jgi:hypothetical protein
MRRDPALASRYEAVAQVRRRMRAGEPLSRAAKAEGIDPRTAAHHLKAAGAIRKSKGGGRWRLTGHAQILSELPVLVAGESRFRMVAVADARQASAVGRWLADVADGRAPDRVTITDAITGERLRLETDNARIAWASVRSDELSDWVRRGGGSRPQSTRNPSDISESQEQAA